MWNKSNPFTEDRSNWHPNWIEQMLAHLLTFTSERLNSIFRIVCINRNDIQLQTCVALFFVHIWGPWGKKCWHLLLHSIAHCDCRVNTSFAAIVESIEWMEFMLMTRHLHLVQKQRNGHECVKMHFPFREKGATASNVCAFHHADCTDSSSIHQTFCTSSNTKLITFAMQIYSWMSSIQKPKRCEYESCAYWMCAADSINYIPNDGKKLANFTILGGGHICG